VNQVEAPPYSPNDEVRAYGREHGIVTEAWSPLVQGACLTNPVVMNIATKLRRSPAPVFLRWHIQRSDIAIPNTTSPERMRENLGLSDYELVR
jgi:2,5-diketo-D-gluconate reductase A